MKKTSIFILLLLFSSLFFSCELTVNDESDDSATSEEGNNTTDTSDDQNTDTGSTDGTDTGGTDTEAAKEINERKFLVISDPHYFDPELGTSGSAFEEYLEGDRKLIAESDAIMASFT